MSTLHSHREARPVPPNGAKWVHVLHGRQRRASPELVVVCATPLAYASRGRPGEEQHLKVDDRHIAERGGVAEVQSRVAMGLNWLFREQAISDFGIDAEIEVVRDGHATGRLLAVQIKSGPSYFREETADGYIYRGNTDHLDYWLNHSLPVIVVLWNPQTNECLWQHVTEKLVERGASGWKITVPRMQTLERSSSDALDRVAGVLWCKITTEEARYLATRIESFGPDERAHFLVTSVFGIKHDVLARLTTGEQERLVQATLASIGACVEVVNAVALRRCNELVASYRGQGNDTFRLALGRLLAFHVLCGVRRLTFPDELCKHQVQFLSEPLEEQIHPVAEELWGLISEADPAIVAASSLGTRYPSFEAIKAELLATLRCERATVLVMVKEIDGMIPTQLLTASEPLRSMTHAGVARRFTDSVQAIERSKGSTP